MSFFKKKGGHVNAANVHMTEAEAALAQSDFNIEKITEIQNKFTGGAVLLVPGRIFIREGLLFKVCRKGLKKRQFFLFNDILVYGSVVANRFSHQQVLPLAQMSVSSDCFYQPRVDADFIAESEQEDLDVSNAFQVSHANKSFHVFGQSAADKANWIANLQKHISRVAKTLPDSQQQMLTRPVWVPDAMSKECMICSSKFTPFVRKHHCRRCGRVICTSCSPHRVSLNTTDGPGGGSGTTVSGEAQQGKLERTCRECFKEMTAVHNRVNSVGRSSKSKYDFNQTEHKSPPPPPDFAAKIVSAAIRSVTGSKTAEEGQRVDSSTDTEDSDDSENEQEEDSSSPVPMKRTALSKVEDQIIPVKPTVKGVCPTPETRDFESKSPIPAKRSSVTKSNGTPTPIMKITDIDEEVDESQPTPPPRKKKLLKQKLKELEELKKTDDLTVSPAPDETVVSPTTAIIAANETDQLVSPTAIVAANETDQSVSLAPIASSPPKKPKRRNKYYKPQDESTMSAGEPAEVSEDMKDMPTGVNVLDACAVSGSNEVGGVNGESPHTREAIAETTTSTSETSLDGSKVDIIEGGDENLAAKNSVTDDSPVVNKRKRRQQKFKTTA